MKLFKKMFSRKQKVQQPVQQFVSHDITDKHYDDFIAYMDKHRNEWG